MGLWGGKCKLKCRHICADILAITFHSESMSLLISSLRKFKGGIKLLYLEEKPTFPVVPNLD